MLMSLVDMMLGCDMLKLWVDVMCYWCGLILFIDVFRVVVC